MIDGKKGEALIRSVFDLLDSAAY